jgi:LacI family transcriptional regulator
VSAVGNGETQPSRPPTLRDVAREARVHVSTVSRVLNDQAAAGRITPDTEERIREVARRLGYRRNTIARALRTGRTLVVGMVVPDVANLYQAGITRGAGDVFYADGYSLILASTDDDPAHAESQVAAMLGVQVEGLMYGVAREDDGVLADIIDEGIPVVLFNRAAGVGVSAVLPDDHAGTKLAVEHLLSLGHTRIVHVGGPEDVSSTVNRLEAFEEALRVARLSGSHHFAQRQNEEEGYRVTRTLLEEHPDTSAVVAANDMPYSERFTPPLTTVRISQYELGARTARLLLETIADPGRAPETQWVIPELVVRGSTAARA